MSTITETKVKFGYLSYEDMLNKIESGELNEFDIIYSRDRLVTYVISEDLNPIEIRSRVYVFNSVVEAENTLNNSTDTYVGQVVAILYNDTYRGYVVNKKSNKYTVVPLWEHPENIDYNTLGNRPIVNLVGTLDEPITISNLDTGFYSIKGQYKISNNDVTTYINANLVLFIVEKNNDMVLVKEISANKIIDYVVTDSSTKVNQIATEEYLTTNGYTTTAYVDEKIEALNVLIKQDIESYITSVIEEKLDMMMDEKIDSRIDAKILGASNAQIISLFN